MEVKYHNRIAFLAGILCFFRPVLAARAWLCFADAGVSLQPQEALRLQERSRGDFHSLAFNAVCPYFLPSRDGRLGWRNSCIKLVRIIAVSSSSPRRCN